MGYIILEWYINSRRRIDYLAVVEFKDDFLEKMTPELNFKEWIDICRVIKDKRENIPGRWINMKSVMGGWN